MQKERFLNLAEQSDVFKTVTANAKFDTDSLVQEVKTKNNNFYSKLVIISGLEKENNFNQFQVFIDPKTKKVVRVNYYEFNR